MLHELSDLLRREQVREGRHRRGLAPRDCSRNLRVADPVLPRDLAQIHLGFPPPVPVRTVTFGAVSVPKELTNGQIGAL